MEASGIDPYSTPSVDVNSLFRVSGINLNHGKCPPFRQPAYCSGKASGKDLNDIRKSYNVHISVA